MEPELLEHFAADIDNCFLNDCSIKLIDKTDSLDSKRKEKYWKYLGKKF